MLYLIVAAPRTGKSQLVASKLYEHKQKGQQVYVTNFKQTPAQIAATGFIHYGNAPDFDVLKETTWRGDVTKWMEDLPDGAIWMIDEAQDVFPQRGKDRQLPEYIKLFSKHGHKDLTIYVVTQDAMQLDVHLRRNSNITYYMTRPLNMRKALIYTFRGYQEIPNDAWRRSQVLKTAESKKKFKYSKKWQDMYESASAHDHIKMRFPLKLLLPIAALVLSVTLIWFGISRLKSTGESEDAPPAVQGLAAAVTGAGAPTAAASPTYPSAPVETPEAWAARQQPRIADIPMSAPLYDGFEVTDYPRLFCYIGRRGCSCVTQQGSRASISRGMCHHYVENGYFDPYKVDRNETPAYQQQQQSVNPQNGYSSRPITSGSVASTGSGPSGSWDIAPYGDMGVQSGRYEPQSVR